MKLSIGIVGLPNVGKSTLFNALLKKQVADAANYPFCTIEPNVGVVEVPDDRLPILAKLVKTEKIVPAIVEFYDIAGLVKGASQGEGLGNKFLSHIREVAVIAHVVRFFEDTNVIHVANKIDPASDMSTIESELILSDLDTLAKQREPKMNASKDERAAYTVVQKLIAELNRGIPARKAALSAEERSLILHLNLLTLKPVIYVFNVSEAQLEQMTQTEKAIQAFLEGIDVQSPYIILNAKLENDVLSLSSDEQKEYLNQYHLSDTGLNRLIRTAYQSLNLISYLTGGELEARAWTVTKGTYAPQAAGVIHTDFEAKFIKADVVPFNSFVEAGGWVKAREMGRVSTVGREYIMQDGDVVEFKIGQ